MNDTLTCGPLGTLPSNPYLGTRRRRPKMLSLLSEYPQEVHDAGLQPETKFEKRNNGGSVFSVNF